MPSSVATLFHYRDAVIGTGALFVVLTGLTVGLRIVSRPWLNIRFGLEDYFMFAAMVLFWTQASFLFLAMNRIEGPNSEPSLDFGKWIWVAGEFYFPTAFAVNSSILCLYRRLFASEQFERIFWVMMCFGLSWVIAGFLTETFACTPVEHMWNPSVEGHCIWYSTFWLVLMIAELAMDAVLFILPLREVAKLQLSTGRKIGVSVCFAIGGLSIITAICRIPYTYRGRSDWFIDIKEDAIWLNCHLGAAIVCACLPTLRPVLNRSIQLFNTGREKYHRSETGSSEYNQRDSTTSTGSSKVPFKNPHHQFEDGVKQIDLTDISPWPGKHDIAEGGAVTVRHTMEVV